MESFCSVIIMTRLMIRASGVVQGIGFRPFVHALAGRHGLSGFVRNEGDGVRIEVEGPPEAVARFRAELAERPPEAAWALGVVTEEMSPQGDRAFTIEPSRD